MISANRAINFMRRERVYIILLVFLIFFHLSFLLLNQLLEYSGIDKLFQEERFKGKEIISNEKIAEVLDSNPIIYFIFFLLFVGFLFFAMLGIGFDIAYLYMRRKKETPIIRTQAAGTGLWDFWDICKVAIIFLFAQRIIWLADTFLLSGIPHLQTRVNLRLMFAATLTDVIGIAAILYFVLNENRQSIASLGLTLRRFFANIKYGIFAYIGLIPILASVMLLSMWIFEVFNIPTEPQPILIILKEEKHIPSLVYMGFFTAFLGPVLEEVFFRGFVYSVFRKRLGIFAGVILSAAFFAYVHANLASFFPIFCLGMFLAYIYEKTGSLVSSITVHIIHNSVMFAFLMFVKIIIG